MSIELYHADCFDVFPTIKDQSIDLVLCDPPYGTTKNKWDFLLDLKELWKHLNRIIKPNSAILLHSQQPFTSVLINSNMDNWRHNWYWNKNNSAGFATAKYRPLQIVEEICVFGLNKVNYYPIMEVRGKERKKGGYSSSDNYGLVPSESFNNLYFPKSLLNFSNASQKNKVHPTQKPVELLEYLIKTYSLEGQTVFDFTMGSGSTGVACKNTNRSFIGIEKELEYYNIAKQRILTEGNTEQQTEDWFDSFLEN